MKSVTAMRLAFLSSVWYDREENAVAGKRRSVLKRILSGTVLGEEGREAYEEDVVSRRYAE